MNQRRQAEGGGSKTRVQGVTTQQSIKATAGTLHRLLVSNADAAVQTLTILDGATTLNVLRQAAGTSGVYALELSCATSILLTPSSANIDALAVWD